MASPDWKSAVEIFPAGWVCPTSPFWVAGWITSASGLVPVDARAWLGPRAFLGLCGLPRPDKEIAARGRAGPPQAGFSFLLKPVPGATGLRIEICDQHGRWTEIFRQTVTSAGCLEQVAAPFGGTQPVLHLLCARNARPRESWSALAAEIVAADAAGTFDVEPSAPFQGALEELGSLAAVHYDHLMVTGWVAHREQRITGLTAFLDTAEALPLVTGLSRPDVGKLFPDLIDGAHSRFSGFLPLPPALPRPLALRIFAELADGRRELVFLKRFRPVAASGGGTDLPPFSLRDFLAAAWALRLAGWGAGQSIGRIWSTLRLALGQYRKAAPHPRRPPPITPDPPAGSTHPLRVTVVTHNLNYEGAPIFLLEYARYLARDLGWKVRVISAREGPLRDRFAAEGLKVSLVDTGSLLAATSPTEFHPALDRLAEDPGWSESDVIVANTLVSFWAVHLAHRLRRPSILYVHESAAVRRFFALQLDEFLLGRVEEAFPLATRVVFPAVAGQWSHLGLAGSGNFRALAGWIDVARIRAYADENPRAAVRQRLGLAEDAVVFANVGSLVPRKGGHVFLDAIERMHRDPPAARRMIFLLIGAGTGPDPYGDLLRHAISTRSLPGVQILEQSSDPYQYFQAADVCVCSSLEEVFPRVVMEAAAFGRLIVTTDVNGIPEMVGPDEAWLVPPGDADRLATAMQAALDAHLRGDQARAQNAQRVVSARFDSAVLLPRHADLVRTVATIHPNSSPRH